jgi:hypothetical protein
MILRYLHFWTPFILQYIVSILALFHGRVIDMPEQAIPADALATGGEVEHQVSPCTVRISPSCTPVESGWTPAEGT